MSSTDVHAAEHATAGYDANLAEVARLDAEDREIFEAAQREIRDANWFSVLFNPLAKISPVLFRRGQMIIWLLRLLAIITGVALMMFGQPMPAAMIIGGTLFITWISSTVQHISRMDHAGKPAFLGLVAAVPLLVLIGLSLAEGAKAAKVWNGMMAARQFSSAMQRGSEGRTAPGAPGAEAPPADSTSAQSGEKSAEGAEKAESETQAQSGQQNNQQASKQRRGPPGGGRGGRGQGGFGQMMKMFNVDLNRVIFGWLAALFGAAIFTWTYAARVNPKGEA